MRHLARIASLVLFGSSALAMQAPQPDCTSSYGSHASQVLDIYLPSGVGDAPFPLVIYVHGGGWASGSRSPIPPECIEMLARGIAVASISYRLTCDDIGDPSDHVFPAQINDVKRAVRWLRYHAATACSQALDPNRFGIHGRSAGGHLALLHAASGPGNLEGVPPPPCLVGQPEDCTSSVVQFASAFAPPSDFEHIQDDVDAICSPRQLQGCPLDDCELPPEPSTCGLNFECDHSILSVLLGAPLTQLYGPPVAQVVHDASPTWWIDVQNPTCPPLFIAHGTLDEIVPFTQSVHLSALLYERGIPHHFRALPDETHRMTWPATEMALADFYDARFLHPETLVNHSVACEGDGSTGLACRCGDSYPDARQGCLNKHGVGGNLEATGNALVAANSDTFVLRADSMVNTDAHAPSVSAYFYRVFPPPGTPTIDRDGLKCFASETLLGSKAIIEGCAKYPEGSNTKLSTGVSAGTTAYYQVRYRVFPLCNPPNPLPLNWWNRTNVLSVTWQ